MSRDRAAIVRLVIIAAACAAAQALTIVIGAPGLALPLGVALAAAAYVASGTLAAPAPRRGEVKYWRGRPVDDRWNGRH